MNNLIKIMDLIQDSLIKVLKEFGVVGLITYIGGLVILLGFLKEGQIIEARILFGLVGIILLVLSTLIAYFRMKIQRDREQALIDMVKNSGNRLAEQLGKGMSKEQVVSITQTIWQNQKDLIIAIMDKEQNKNKMNL